MTGIGERRAASGTEDPKRHTPLESLFLAWIAMVPIAAGAALAWVVPEGRAAVTSVTVGWSGAILCFLAGVRRGLSFRQPGGPKVRQLDEMLLIFCLGSAALLSPSRRLALPLLTAGFASLGVLDTRAAKAGDAPRYFARLRPWQMAVPTLALASLVVLGGRTASPKTRVPRARP